MGQMGQPSIGRGQGLEAVPGVLRCCLSHLQRHPVSRPCAASDAAQLADRPRALEALWLSAPLSREEANPAKNTPEQPKAVGNHHAYSSARVCTCGSCGARERTAGEVLGPLYLPSHSSALGQKYM